MAVFIEVFDEGGTSVLRRTIDIERDHAYAAVDDSGATVRVRAGDLDVVVPVDRLGRVVIDTTDDPSS